MNAQQQPQLRFGADGKFTVLQVSDIQEANGLSPRTKELFLEALDRVKPDFVVFTGDQIKGYGLSLLMGTPEQKQRRITRTINELAGPLAARSIPFTITFGNHDHDAPIDGLAQINLYRRWPNCLTQHSPEVPGYANHAIPIAASAGGKGAPPAMLFYFLDSHGPQGLGYTALKPEQIDWYRQTREKYAARSGHYIPSMLFQHVPVEEIIELFRVVPKKTAGAFEGFRNYKGKWYALDEDKTAPGSFMGELPSSPDENAGLFEAALEKGEMIGMFFGHDHNNGFHGNVRGIQLGYAPAAGFSAYGPGRRRGVRVFEFDEANLRDFKSYVITDEEVFGPEKRIGLRVKMQDKTPSSFGEAKHLIRRSLANAALGTGIAAIAVTAIVIAKKIKARNDRLMNFL